MGSGGAAAARPAVTWAEPTEGRRRSGQPSCIPIRHGRRPPQLRCRRRQAALPWGPAPGPTDHGQETHHGEAHADRTAAADAARCGRHDLCRATRPQRRRMSSRPGPVARLASRWPSSRRPPRSGTGRLFRVLARVTIPQWMAHRRSVDRRRGRAGAAETAHSQPARVAQRKSAPFTPGRSQVRSLARAPADRPAPGTRQPARAAHRCSGSRRAATVVCPSGQGTACKAVDAGSNPATASMMCRPRWSAPQRPVPRRGLRRCPAAWPAPVRRPSGRCCAGPRPGGCGRCRPGSPRRATGGRDPARRGTVAHRDRGRW